MTSQRSAAARWTLAGILILAGCEARRPAEADVRTVPAADHHLHIRSAAGVEILREIDRLLGDPRAEADLTRRPMTAADALAALDAAGVEHGLVLSIAYMFGAPAAEVERERDKVRAENDYVAEQVALHRDRLVGACSVSPLADYALDELARCATDERIGAFKLHLANSGVDLRDPAHVARLRDVVAALGRAELPTVVHVRNRDEGYGAEDARVFIREVLPAAPDLPLQIAHMAGWGGYDDATDAALGAFIEAIRDGELEPSRVTFDLAAVVFQPAAAGADTALVRRVREANARLAERIDQLGAERVVFATDWPSWPPGPEPVGAIAANLRLLEAELPIGDAAWRAILSNVNAVLDAGRPKDGTDR